MKSLNEVREYLKDVKCYYSHLELFKNTTAIDYIPIKEYKRYINKFNIYLESAPRRIRDVFYGIYVGVRTQKQLAIEWQVKEKYIQILNKRLIVYMQPLLEDKPKRPIQSKKKVESKTFNLVWFD